MNETYATLPIPTAPLAQKGWTASFWTYLVKYARASVSAGLRAGIHEGFIEISDAVGVQKFGVDDEKDPKHSRVSLIVKDQAFWVRIYLSYDIGFSESYMNQEFECSPSIKDVLNIYVDNLASLDSRLSSSLYKLKTALDVFAHRFISHGLLESVWNVAGYDASNDLYQSFLSEELQYSCPIWSEEEGGVRGDLDSIRPSRDLETAQARKISYMLNKARLQPGHRLLEIGTGWGSLAIAAAKMGCQVDTLTLSVEQKALADIRIKEAGVESQVTVHLMDYRNMPPEFKSVFDACISLEMLEAVGIRYMSTYIKLIDWALKDKKAAVVLSATTYPDATFTPYQGNDFVRKYHWPATIPPSATWLANEFCSTSVNRFSLESLDDFGIHYPRCLREWSRRLEKSWDEELVQSLQDRYPALKDEHNLKIYKTRWTYMFTYMEVAYSRVWLSLNCWTFVRPGYTKTICA
ncbi:S-adenosyl-L-methionine-dependent methyltransferase [Mycena floridula]|nr:S-adenosyl-L-methionine-dependent methyltransferase [Mycena floridula]